MGDFDNLVLHNLREVNNLILFLLHLQTCPTLSQICVKMGKLIRDYHCNTGGYTITLGF